MNITAKTRLNMVIGYPLAHTQSPLLHNTVYQLLGINNILLAAPHHTLTQLMDVIKTLSVELTAVTMPFKEQILEYCDDCSIEARELHCANTIIQRDGKLYGYNTDLDGIAYALRHHSLAKRRVLVIGAGGAAKTVGYFFKKNQADLFFMNRTIKKARTLANELGGEVIHRDLLNDIYPEIIINTTPLGLYPHIDQTPLPDYRFHPDQVVFDMVYHPIKTQLLKQAEMQQASIISGLDMFICQGLKQIELFSQTQLINQALIEQLKIKLIQNQRESYNELSFS